MFLVIPEEGIMRRFRRSGTALLVAGSILVAACTDRGGSTLPVRPTIPEPGASLATVACSASVSERTLTCLPGRSAAGVRANEILYGGQHTHVSVISTLPVIQSDTFAFSLRIRNLIPQPIGTTDGVTADPSGVRVFFAAPPAVTGGTGTVTVANADGTAPFTAADQPFFRYVGMLRTDSISAARTWKFQFTPDVQKFSFLLFVSSPVPFPQGWVDLLPDSTVLPVGGEDTMRAVVRSALGVVLPPGGLTWTSSAPDSVTVTPLPGDSLAVVRALGGADATITATSAPRTGHATARAERDPAAVPRRLDVAGAGSGDGVVSSTPAGILCSVVGGVATGGCSALFPYGTAVTLDVTAAAGGHAFAGWSGACGGAAASCGVTLTQARAVGAQLTAPAGAPAYRPPGIDFSPFVDGQNPDLGSVVGADQVRARLVLTRSLTPWVRTFGSRGGLQHAPAIARELGLKVACGAWIDGNETSNQAELAGLLESMRAGNCDLAIVGSEMLRRVDVTEGQLISYVRQVRQAGLGVPVTTADIYGELRDRPALIAELDLLMVNVYPYWEKVPLQYALFHVDTVYQSMVAVAGGKPVYISESGWPSCGEAQGPAEPSETNAAQHFLNFASWARSRSVTYFYFEALDEAWHTVKEGPQGACWGIMDRHGVLKTGMQAVFDGATVPDNWSGETVVGGAGTPSIAFTHVPVLGATLEDLEGSVAHVKPVEYRVALYIRVGGLWYVKPYADSRRAIRIRPDGTWSADIVTGGSDQNATEITAFLVPTTYDAPPVFGAPSLPPELAANAVASVSVTR
jgi:exo-beta-1,3-glucanase (GH17 family)